MAECSTKYFYTSAFRRRRHQVFGLSVRLSIRLSIRSPKYPLSTCTWSIWPTVTVLRHVRPSVCPSVRLSVRPERFLDICLGTHGGNGLKFCMLMYHDHLQNWLDYGHGLFIFLLLAPVWLSETGKFVVSRHLLKNARREWAEILYADVSWPPPELISLWLRSNAFYNFWNILTSWNGSNLGFRAFSGERMEGMGSNFACWCILTTFRNDQFIVTVCCFF